MRKARPRGHAATSGVSLVEILLKTLVAALLGGLVGYERWFRGKHAGMKTYAMICLGSALYTVIGDHMGLEQARVVAQIVSGVGFLGAGAIIKDSKMHVAGLTTAALIWVVAAIGIMVGLDMFVEAVTVTGVAGAVIAGISRMEKKLPRKGR